MPTLAMKAADQGHETTLAIAYMLENEKVFEAVTRILLKFAGNLKGADKQVESIYEVTPPEYTFGMSVPFQMPLGHSC